MRARTSRARRGASAERPADAGATAVEFALVLPVLLLFLFGVIQYGFGLYQLQAFNSTLTDATRLAATGVQSCGAFGNVLKDLAGGDGLDKTKVTGIKVRWLTPTGAATNAPDRLGLAQVSATYAPTDLNLPFLPFPNQVTRTQTVPIQDIGLSSLIGCG